MATLSSLGLLLIFIALSAPPPSANHVTVQMAEYSLLTFAKSNGGWWTKSADTGMAIYYKCDGTTLVTRSASGQEESMDVASFFDLTGGENWSRPLIIRGKFAKKKTEVRTRTENNRIIAAINDDGKTGEAIVTWSTASE